MDPEKKSLNFIFPTKYVIPKSLKFSHWPSKKTLCVYQVFNLVPDPLSNPSSSPVKVNHPSPFVDFMATVAGPTPLLVADQEKGHHTRGERNITLGFQIPLEQVF